MELVVWYQRSVLVTLSLCRHPSYLCVAAAWNGDLTYADGLMSVPVAVAGFAE
jgi:hypothetical protein